MDVRIWVDVRVGADVRACVDVPDQHVLFGVKKNEVGRMSALGLMSALGRRARDQLVVSGVRKRNNRGVGGPTFLGPPLVASLDLPPQVLKQNWPQWNWPQ